MRRTTHILPALFLVLVLSSQQSIAQEMEHKPEKEEHGMKGSHRLALGLGHTHIAEGSEDGKKGWMVVPSWALNYDYWISNKWAVGLHTDFIIESYKIESNEKEIIERDHPVALVPVALFKPFHHWTFVGGIGQEYGGGYSPITLTRLGVEYGWELPSNWEIGFEFAWDAKWDYYNAWALTISFSKIFPKKHRME